MTRLLTSLLACGLACLALTAATPDEKKPAENKATAQKGDKPGEKAHADHKVPKDTCVKPCLDCQAACLTCMKHCREHKMEAAAKQCEICHHACLLCYHAVGSKNVRAWEICELCEKVCNDCAAVCEKGDDEMKKCAKACRDCAKACADARK
jgi:hypothetical protein